MSRFHLHLIYGISFGKKHQFYRFHEEIAESWSQENFLTDNSPQLSMEPESHAWCEFQLLCVSSPFVKPVFVDIVIAVSDSSRPLDSSSAVRRDAQQKFLLIRRQQISEEVLSDISPLEPAFREF